MMPGIGFTEMILLVVISLVVIGPKDLPLMMRKFGKFTGQMRALAFEFRQGIDELGRQAELEELRKEVASLKASTGVDELQKELADDQRALRSEIEGATGDTPSLPAPEQTTEPAPGSVEAEAQDFYRAGVAYEAEVYETPLVEGATESAPAPRPKQETPA